MAKTAKFYTPPTDKAITQRALLLAAISEGTTRITNPSVCSDTAAAISCLKQLGARIVSSKNAVTVKGAGLRGFKKPARPLNAGESATAMRLLAGLLAGQEFDSVITGVGSLLSRPMERVTSPLSAMGARIASRGGRPPLKIRGSRLTGADHQPGISSAQIKSALLLAGLYAEGPTSITERFRTRDHTERLLKHLGAQISTDGLNTYLRPGRLTARDITIPGDISSAAPFITAACLLPGFRLTIKNVGLNPGRMGLITSLKAMGARITVKPAAAAPEPCGDIVVSGSALHGVRIRPDEIPAMIDELPLLALAASRAQGSTVINGAGELRHKESDRLASTVALLTALGLEAKAGGDKIVIKGSQSIAGGKSADTRGDHRIAMAAAVSGLLAANPVKINDRACVKKSYPAFFRDFKKIFP